ncbi:MAG TPA: CRISPR-associated endonuclease Cas1 [Terriglobales bacterium]|nr:CRISPR-associated endonuclease Cas1 [Terriglobales bacterium]
MAATPKLSQLQPTYNSVAPRHGVITLFGYGIQVRVERGHLVLEDGIGPERIRYRLAKVGHELRRLIIIGSDGNVSLAALRWLSDQDVALSMLERDGKVLAVTGPVRSSDAKLRRAQALALNSEIGLTIARELIFRKIAGQENVAREVLRNSTVADEIARVASLAESQGLDSVRLIESQAAAVYWAAWRDVPIIFPAKELCSVPNHWLTFGTRKSLLTGSPRLAVNPPNAMLNYLYALLESESRLAAAALGLDPGLGVLHMDTAARDSLACDLMEAIRPQVDRYVLTWLLSRPLRRDWFFEQRNGNCRLMSSLATQLAETSPAWARAVAPVAEWVARELWSTTRKRVNTELPPTRLTQNRKRQAKGRPSETGMVSAPLREKLCHNCGKRLSKGGERLCIKCAQPGLVDRMRAVAAKGRLTAQSPTAQVLRSATQKRNWSKIREWKQSGSSVSVNEQTYTQEILPRLANCKSSEIARTLGVSLQYAVWIRRGLRQPHPRHWQPLARLAGLFVDRDAQFIASGRE